MHLRAIGRQFTQMNAYFLVMNSKRCNTRSPAASQPFIRQVTEHTTVKWPIEGLTLTSRRLCWCTENFLLFCTPTWPSHHVDANQELLHFVPHQGDLKIYVSFRFSNFSVTAPVYSERQCGPVVRALAFKSGDPRFKTRSDHSLNLFLVVPGSTFQLHL